ncbi:class I SAM-dependent methyltransferase [Nocardioides taihuensis]|jgi:ubiquinone/menaquinone biosynthesis C-methylase UbiE|uniref:Class I SAM-dependent methyltransferase n=1 Tax=Nocardioides taihuensis TaxID=1835606 RepID=A0ABW0BDR0_9ACTN
MSAVEAAFCRSALWRWFAWRGVLPWALRGDELAGDVLEIGAGSGAMAAGIVESFPEVRLVVTDLDKVMVDSARDRFQGRGSVEVGVADVTSLPFEASSFDAVTSFLMLHHVIDWTDALTECARVLRPGGALVGYDLTDTRAARLLHRLDGSPHRIVAAAELRAGLARVGLAEVDVRSSLAGHLMRFRAVRPH